MSSPPSPKTCGIAVLVGPMRPGGVHPGTRDWPVRVRAGVPVSRRRRMRPPRPIVARGAVAGPFRNGSFGTVPV